MRTTSDFEQKYNIIFLEFLIEYLNSRIMKPIDLDAAATIVPT